MPDVWDQYRVVGPDAERLAAELRLGFGHFHLQVGDNRYRLTRGWRGNIELVTKDGEPLQRYCAHPVDQAFTDFVDPHAGPGLHDGDVLAAQVLWLRYAETEFLATANIHWAAWGFIRGDLDVDKQIEAMGCADD